MIDLHNHVLFGLDDGCRTPEESRGLAEAMSAVGHARVVATPHIRPGLFSNTVDGIRQRRDEVRPIVEAAGLELSLGAEYYFDPSIMEAARKKTILTLGETSRFFLLELPQTQMPPRTFDWIFELRLAGYVPVIAHPERCRGVQEGGAGSVELFARAGVLLQLDIGSLLGHYGEGARKAAVELVKLGAYHVVACDLHRPEDVEALVVPGKRELAALLKKRKKDSELERLTVGNPGLILANAPIEQIRPV